VPIVDQKKANGDKIEKNGEKKAVEVVNVEEIGNDDVGEKNLINNADIANNVNRNNNNKSNNHPDAADNINNINNIKDDFLGISFDNYYNALLVDYTRRITLLNLSGEFINIPEAPDRDVSQAQYNSMSDEDLKRTYDDLLEKNSSLWEYSYDEYATKGAMVLPKDIRNTGNVEILSNYYNEFKGALGYELRFLINKRIETANRIRQTKEAANEKMSRGEEPVFEPEVKVTEKADGSEAVRIANVHQTERQSTGNGCWSVCIANIVSSRGVKVSQSDIRGVRPDYDKDTANNLGEMADESFNTDSQSNIMEKSDAVINFLPGHMVKELEIVKYEFSEAKDEISREEYDRNAIEQVKNAIIQAIKVDKSPIGLLEDGHYLTITGIDGDTIEYKNSAGINPDPDHTYTGSLTALIGDIMASHMLTGIQLTWVKKIELSKDGRTIFGVPSDYVRMNPDGTVKGQPGPIRLGGGITEEELETNQEGITVGRHAGVEDTSPEQEFRPKLYNGVVRNEKVYLPKKLNADYLREKADERSNQDERRLRGEDNAFYDLNRPLDPVMEDPGIPDFETKMQEAQLRIENEKKTGYNKSVTDGAAKLAGGEDAEFSDIKFFTSMDKDIFSLSDDERRRVKRVCDKVFDKVRNLDIFDTDSILNKFTYRKTPDSEPVNIWNEVTEKLKTKPNNGNLKSETIRSYVRPVVLRAMRNQDAALSFENDDHTLNNIFAAPSGKKRVIRNESIQEIEQRPVKFGQSGVTSGQITKTDFQNLNSKTKQNKVDAAKKKSKKPVKSEETLKFTSNPQAPDLKNRNQRAWVQSLSSRAEESQGKVFDSDQFKEFYKNARIISELAVIIGRTEKITLNDIKLPDDFKTLSTRAFSKETRALFGDAANTNLTEVKEKYRVAWNSLVQSAEAYEEFKIKDKGFTRDENNHDRHQLKSRSKLKFALMDEIFYPEKRKIPEMNKGGLQK